MRIRESLVKTASLLSSDGIDDADLEAEVLLRHALGWRRTELFAALEAPVPPSVEGQLRILVNRRLGREPLAYLLGHREFYGLDFLVNAHVLIPRQETEVLVDRTLEHCSSRKGRRDGLLIADVGTGCGAIAIAIAANLPHVTICATDVSREALTVADINRRHHGLQERVQLVRADLLHGLPGPADVIVSNPPYLKTEEIPQLAAEIGREPVRALNGGADGLDVIRRLLHQAGSALRPGGCLLVEIAPEQQEAVSQLATELFRNAHVSFASDSLGLARALVVELDTVEEYQEIIPATDRWNLVESRSA